MIVAPAGTALLSQLTTKVPIVYINDRCIPGAIEYHDILKNLFDWSKKGSIQTEKRAIANSSLTIYSSSWAADAAKENFAEYANKIQVIPFGANFDETPSFHGAKTLQTETIKLLFVGVKWIEKGGNIALQALKELHAKNIKAELIICGCVPPDEVSKTAGVKIEGFLSKKNPSPKRRTDFLIGGALILNKGLANGIATICYFEGIITFRELISFNALFKSFTRNHHIF